MLLSEITAHLAERDSFKIHLPDGSEVPGHFHVTEVGEVTKEFIDCGGTRRRERRASLQLWNANDYDHRLAPGKLVHIIELARKALNMGDLPAEVEYQGDQGIVKFGLEATEAGFRLTPTATACLALEECGVDARPGKVSLSKFVASAGSSCAPGGGCC